jgi:ferredoxin
VQVSIDQTLCRGDCICEQICPRVFALDEDGIAHVVADGGFLMGADGWAQAPEGAEDLVLDAARECPSQAILVRGAAEDTAAGGRGPLLDERGDSTLRGGEGVGGLTP